MTLTLVGSAASMRTRGLLDAADSLGIPTHVHPWDDVLQEKPCPATDGWAKLEPPQLTPAVARGLIRAAAPGLDVTGDPGLRHARLLHAGFATLLARVEAELGPAALFSPVSDLVVLADKLRCQKVFADRGLPIPEPLQAELDALLDAIPAVGDGCLVKLRWGAAAAGILALERTPAGLRAFTTMIPEEDGWYSSRRVRCTTELDAIRAAVEWLIEEGAHAERWVRKETMDGQIYDVRVVTIAGRATHIVGRATSGPHPFTNLHLGGRRIEAADVRDHLGADGFERVLALCESAAGGFPRCLCIGFDVLVSEDGPRLIEANPFGDLLHGVLWNGWTTYEAQLRAMAERVSTRAAVRGPSP